MRRRYRYIFASRADFEKTRFLLLGLGLPMVVTAFSLWLLA